MCSLLPAHVVGDSSRQLCHVVNLDGGVGGYQQTTHYTPGIPDIVPDNQTPTRDYYLIVVPDVAAAAAAVVAGSSGVCRSSPPLVLVLVVQTDSR